MEVALPYRLDDRVVVVNDVLSHDRLSAVDLDAVMRDDRIGTDALGVEALEQRLLLGRVGVTFLDVRDRNFAVREDLFEVAFVDERLDVSLDVVHVAVDGADSLDLLDLVDVTALVCERPYQPRMSQSSECENLEGEASRLQRRADSRTTGCKYLWSCSARAASSGERAASAAGWAW